MQIVHPQVFKEYRSHFGIHENSPFQAKNSISLPVYSTPRPQPSLLIRLCLHENPGQIYIYGFTGETQNLIFVHSEPQERF